MLGKVYSGALSGVDGKLVCVEADAGEGLPQFDMIGMLEKSVSEARERVRTALKNTGIYLEARRYTVSLSPADLKKQGNSFDLPIAMAVLIAIGAIFQKKTDSIMFLGELGLDGSLKPIDGALPLAIMARDKGYKSIVVPFENGPESSIVEGIDVYPLKSIREVMNFIEKPECFIPLKTDARDILERADKEESLDMADISGQDFAKRATEIAAAGSHNILYIGPPGSGKTMLAKRFSSIQPKLTFEEAMEITKIYSIAGLLPRECAIMTSRPFRSPHHSTSMQALVGGGRIPKPGEVTLAHNGVLFIDELAEAPKSTLDSLRIPLEDKEIVLSRVQATYRFPADCQLIAAMNPCSCGFYPDRTKCHCSVNDVNKYLGKISRPLLDRIDICVEVAKPDYGELVDKRSGETSREIRHRVEAAVERQRYRYKDENILYNSQLTPKLIEKYCQLGKNEEALLRDAFDRMNLSARAYHRIIKVARTIADVADSQRITEEHICEAIGYRSFDKEVWS